MSAPTRAASRYQRRILGLGIVVACVGFVLSARIYLDRIEADLTERVTDALVAAGFDGFTVSFSGQTGSITCTEPLSDPQLAVDTAYAVRGVHAVDALPEGCRVLTQAADSGADATDDAAAATVPAATRADGATVDAAASTTSTIAADFQTVAAIVDGSPQFSLLAQLVVAADLHDELATDGPFTLFAPTDAAFDALPADAVAQLWSDPAVLQRVLRHHLVDGRLLTDDLATGPLPSAAGDTLDVVAGDEPTIDGALIIDADVVAANGVVHAVDRLLLPDDVDLSSPVPLESTVATFGDGGFVLEGVVRSEVERAVLVDAATSVVAPELVTDQLTTDPDLGLDEPTAQALASLIAVLPGNLIDGTAGFDGSMLFLKGTYLDDEGRAAVDAVAAAVDVEAALEPRPEATEGDANRLEAELNAFVVEHPIQFAPSASSLDESAAPILDEIARRAAQFGGVTIAVEGHTDSDGDEIENLALSQRRADAVRDALIARGLDGTSITAQGFGSTQPVLVDGTEDKDASRRVEFRVEVVA